MDDVVSADRPHDIYAFREGCVYGWAVLVIPASPASVIDLTLLMAGAVFFPCVYKPSVPRPRVARRAARTLKSHSLASLTICVVGIRACGFRFLCLFRRLLRRWPCLSFVHSRCFGDIALARSSIIYTFYRRFVWLRWDIISRSA